MGMTIDDYERLEDCPNYEEVGDLCVKCNMCGRFDEDQGDRMRLTDFNGRLNEEGKRLFVEFEQAILDEIDSHKDEIKDIDFSDLKYMVNLATSLALSAYSRGREAKNNAEEDGND